MAEPMNGKRNRVDNNQTETRKGFFKRSVSKMKKDFHHGSRVEKGSLIDQARKGFKTAFPKKNKRR